MVINPAAAHSYLYGAYLTSTSWALRRLVATFSGDGKAFDQVIKIPTPGLGDGNVSASVCLPQSKNPAGGRLPCVLVLEGGGFILGEPNDGQDMCREMADEVGSNMEALATHGTADTTVTERRHRHFIGLRQGAAIPVSARAAPGLPGAQVARIRPATSGPVR